MDGKLFYETRGGEKKEVQKRPVGRPPQAVKYTSPSPTAFNLGSQPEPVAPVALKTELATIGQIRPDENTLIWGLDDAEPLRILKAIAESPTTSNCIGKVEMFTRGAGFNDEGLETMVIDDEGNTLLDLHNELTKYYVQLGGFAVNFKYNMKGKIASAYNMNLDACRLVAKEGSSRIAALKYNPYFGTGEYQSSYTKRYHLFDLNKFRAEYKVEGDDYLGQAYFFSDKGTIFKHYPIPTFWSGKKWIYADAKFATYIDKLLDNGFFESVLLKMIGDPNVPSQHPSAMREVEGEDGVKRKESVKSEGEVFSEQMGRSFSGVEKAGKVLVMWAANKDQSPSLEAFPTNVQPDLISGTLLETIRMVAISTDVPAILANLPNSLSSLASGGDAVKSAVEYMQASTAYRRNNLEKFYNSVLIPNLEKATKARVKLKPYSPFKIQVTIEDKFWEFMNEAEKIDFIKNNEPDIVLNRSQEAQQNTVPATTDQNGNVIPAPTAPQVDETLKGIKVSEINRILSIVKKVEAGTLTPDQAKMLLSGYGLNETQINAFLNPQPVEL